MLYKKFSVSMIEECFFLIFMWRRWSFSFVLVLLCVVFDYCNVNLNLY
ncbi:tubby-like F-box protein 5 [Iris pallida]|uniref:Tubby-like F-box protein 5 n=1 Tax=Iris pallida TaxID=29817 RepID=A0AAX6FS50_IRIPA|nr:tubby-like F-box protein 5 [Iris pallida]